MKLKNLSHIDAPYVGISSEDYQIEKRRLQVELLEIQQRLIKNQQRLAVIFEGRDAAGKGSTIKRFNQYLMPRHTRVVALDIPTEKESRYWFRRYEKELPRPGQITFFDRSWYSRALIEPTMGYCSESRYRYFMNKVLEWEHNLIDNGLLLVKFYLSIDRDAQLYRFEYRLNNPLTYWKFSSNDLESMEKWELFTHYKEQMYAHTSSADSPWVVVAANKKKEARLTSMLHLVRLLGTNEFEPMTGEDITTTHSIKVAGVKFRGLSLRQLAVLQDIKNKEKK